MLVLSEYIKWPLSFFLLTFLVIVIRDMYQFRSSFFPRSATKMFSQYFFFLVKFINHKLRYSRVVRTLDSQFLSSFW